jgi:SAM-dependent methyltransferase
MAHPAQQEFCRQVKNRFGEFFRNVRVLEMGARDVNGSVREAFVECEYVGVDCEAGKGVDVVCLGHAYEDRPESFDVICALETFEHDPHAEQTIAGMLELLKVGGLFFMTCAGEGRAEHGTRRTGKRYGPEADFYRNVTLEQFWEWIHTGGIRFQEVYLKHNRTNCDLYFFGIKA